MDEPENPTHENEGVRIIGAQEAAEALERGDVAKRRPTDAPRYGDRPTSPPDDGPRPAIRFPLDSSTDPTDVGRPQVAAAEPGRPEGRPSGGPAGFGGQGSPGGGSGDGGNADESGTSSGPTTGSQPQLQHWTEPATGEVPRILAGDDAERSDDDLEAWSSFTSSGPRWRGEATDYDAHDYDDLSQLGDDDTRVGALDPDRPREGYFGFDELDAEGEPSAAERERAPRPISSDPRRAAPPNQGRVPLGPKPGTGRDIPTAVGVGALLAGVFLLFATIGGPPWVAALVVAALVMAAAEFFNTVRRAGHQPAVLLGLATVGSLPAAAYWKGPEAIPLVLFLSIVFGLLWYLAGVSSDRPVSGAAITWLGVGYIGVLGSFAALMLKLPDGVGVLMGAVVATVAYDIGGYVVGSSRGRSPLSAASPNKTKEGLLGGCAVAVLAAILVAGRFHPWTDTIDAFKLGVVVAVAAPLGDLCESLLKRDLGVKDMGDILPGHGGVLDRFDALLFVLPSVYYLAVLLGVG